MAKINASTGQVIKKDSTDIHIPPELQQVQPEQQVEEHDDFIRRIDKDYLVKSEEQVADDSEDVNASSTEDIAREEELQVVDDSSGDE